MLKNILFALLSGLLLSVSWPTYGISLFVFIGFVPLLIVEKNVRDLNYKFQRSIVFFLAFLTFVVWNTITTWWIWNATPFGGVFAIFVNSLLMSIVFLLYHFIAKRKTINYSLFFFISIWIAFEKFHHNWDFSWPWLTLGNVFSDNTQWIQWYEYTGIFGGSLWVLMVNSIFYKAYVSWKNVENNRIIAQKILLGFTIIVIGIFISKLIYIAYHEEGEEVSAIVIQPNTNPYTEKYHRSHEQIAEELIELALPEMDDDIVFVLAPETVFSNKGTLHEFVHSEAYSKLVRFGNLFPNTSFLTGFDQMELFSASISKSKTANKIRNNDRLWYESYNSALFLSHDVKPQLYHKSKLVVGVEHFPFRPILEPLLGNILIDLGGSISTVTPQKDVSVFINPKTNISIAPIICYESIYGEFTTKYIRKGANILGIITNDSWWGNTQGHKQLLSYAKLRAVETRRAIARSANSGISAFIDQKGEIKTTLPYETQGALKGSINSNHKITMYVKYGDYIARIAFLLAVLMFLTGIFRNRKPD